LCHFAQPSISYLGHVISNQGVTNDPTKIQSIQDWLLPKDVKQLRSFLRLAGYYRKFVQHFVIIAHPSLMSSIRVLYFSMDFNSWISFRYSKTCAGFSSYFGPSQFLKALPMAFEDEKEYLDILVAMDQWCAYLQHGEFIIFTYH
jgi:hypothetical protein